MDKMYDEIGFSQQRRERERENSKSSSKRMREDNGKMKGGDDWEDYDHTRGDNDMKGRSRPSNRGGVSVRGNRGNREEDDGDRE